MEKKALSFTSAQHLSATGCADPAHIPAGTRDSCPLGKASSESPGLRTASPRGLSLHFWPGNLKHLTREALPHVPWGTLSPGVTPAVQTTFEAED